MVVRSFVEQEGNGQLAEALEQAARDLHGEIGRTGAKGAVNRAVSGR